MSAQISIVRISAYWNSGLNEAANRDGIGEVARLASCLRGFRRCNPPSDRKFPDGRDQPSASLHD
jgi:hypothetical protein